MKSGLLKFLSSALAVSMLVSGVRPAIADTYSEDPAAYITDTIPFFEEAQQIDEPVLTQEQLIELQREEFLAEEPVPVEEETLVEEPAPIDEPVPADETLVDEDPAEAEEIGIEGLLRIMADAVLGREITQSELESWSQQLEAGRDFDSLLEEVIGSPESQAVMEGLSESSVSLPVWEEETETSVEFVSLLDPVMATAPLAGTPVLLQQPVVQPANGWQAFLQGDRSGWWEQNDFVRRLGILLDDSFPDLRPGAALSPEEQANHFLFQLRQLEQGMGQGRISLWTGFCRFVSIHSLLTELSSWADSAVRDPTWTSIEQAYGGISRVLTNVQRMPDVGIENVIREEEYRQLQGILGAEGILPDQLKMQLRYRLEHAALVVDGTVDGQARRDYGTPAGDLIEQYHDYARQALANYNQFLGMGQNNGPLVAEAAGRMQAELAAERNVIDRVAELGHLYISDDMKRRLDTVQADLRNLIQGLGNPGPAAPRVIVGVVDDFAVAGPGVQVFQNITPRHGDDVVSHIRRSNPGLPASDILKIASDGDRDIQLGTLGLIRSGLAKVINASWVVLDSAAELLRWGWEGIVRWAERKGMFFIGGAGNDNWESEPGAPPHPNNYEVSAPARFGISVGSKVRFGTSDLFRGYFLSSHLAAVAVDVSLLSNPGTSFATGWITGKVSQLLTANAGLTKAQMIAALRAQGFAPPQMAAQPTYGTDLTHWQQFMRGHSLSSAWLTEDIAPDVQMAPVPAGWDNSNAAAFNRSLQTLFVPQISSLVTDLANRRVTLQDAFRRFMALHKLLLRLVGRQTPSSTEPEWWTTAETWRMIRDSYRQMGYFLVDIQPDGSGYCITGPEGWTDPASAQPMQQGQLEQPEGGVIASVEPIEEVTGDTSVVLLPGETIYLWEDEKELILLQLDTA